MDPSSWIDRVATIEGATFTGVGNLILLLVCIITAVRKEPLSPAITRDVSVLMLSAVFAFLACVATVSFAGLP